MLRSVATAALVLVLSGCAIAPEKKPTLGNFAANVPAGYDESMAADAVKQLLAFYPPAQTRFDLQQPTPDTFGSLLIASLRNEGYALYEFTPASAGSTQLAAPQPQVDELFATTEPRVPLKYVVDQAGGSQLYRVTLMVGSQSLSRAYRPLYGAVFPISYWVRME